MPEHSDSTSQSFCTFRAMQLDTVITTLIGLLLAVSSSYGSTISSVQTYDGGGWCGANGGCKIKVRGTGFGDEFNRPVVRLLPQLDDPQIPVTGSVPCNIIKYWTSNTTIICTIGSGAYSMFHSHERFKYFQVQVTYNYRRARCTASHCRILLSKVENAEISRVAIPNADVRSVSFGDAIELHGRQLYNSDKADTHNIVLGHLNNRCNPAGTSAIDAENNVPLLPNSYYKTKCRMDNEMLYPGKYNVTLTVEIRHCRGIAILKNSALIPDLFSREKVTYMLTVTPTINSIVLVGRSPYGGNELYIHGHGFGTNPNYLDVRITLASNRFTKCESIRLISEQKMYCKVGERHETYSKKKTEMYMGNRGISFELYKMRNDCSPSTIHNVNSNTNFAISRYDKHFVYDNFDNYFDRPNIE